MKHEWVPPTTKTSYVKMLRSHTAGFIEFGYRPVEARLSPLGHALFSSGTRAPTLTGARGMPISVNLDWIYYASVEWDLVEYLAAQPPSDDGKRSDRKRQTFTHITPPWLDFNEALVYFHLRQKRLAPSRAAHLAVPLGELARSSGPEQVATLFASFAGGSVTDEEALALIKVTSD